MSLGGLVWLLAYGLPPGVSRDPDLIYRFGGVIALGLIVGAELAIWLDRGIVPHVRDMISAVVHNGGPRRRVGASGGWGELSDLSDRLQILLARQRQMTRTVEEYERMIGQIAAAREIVERWIRAERWRELPSGEGPLLALTDALNRGFVRQNEVLDQCREATRQVAADLASSLQEARESAEHAEHTFIDATGLLTSLRELQRLTAELQQVVAAPLGVGVAAEPAYEQWRAAAAGAIEELIAAGVESVEHLGTGLVRVQEIAGHVHLISNRATLIALNSVIAERRPEGPKVRDDLVDELKRLAREVGEASERVDDLSQDVGREVQAATERMRSTRERVVARLEQPPSTPAAPSGPLLADDVLRLFDRLRETMQEATRKGEDLAAAGERASSASQSLIRSLEDETRDTEGLVVRLSPVESGRDRRQS